MWDYRKQIRKVTYDYSNNNWDGCPYYKLHFMHFLEWNLTFHFRFQKTYENLVVHMSEMPHNHDAYHSKLNIPQNADFGPHFAFYDIVMSCLPVRTPNL